LRLDSSYDGSVGCKHLKEIKYWKLGLSGSTLQTITGDE
jgi:hypothetical protein